MTFSHKGAKSGGEGGNGRTKRRGLSRKPDVAVVPCAMSGPDCVRFR